MNATGITITNHETGETISLERDVCHSHPDWVHEQLGTKSEADLQHALDQCDEDAYYDADGTHKGPDVYGVSLYRDEDWSE